ncbi:carbohydrate ABC transporter permease [Kribbella sp. NPDC051586]|uniref:carbohydrate ABC transporter permease n=1 Tax=Kribbella sp. NPDC051586 TaxID=3364118 RepID=UPI0037877C24
MARNGSLPGEPRHVAYLYLLPGLLLISAFVLLPLLHTGWLSLFEWDGATVGRWVGLDNYTKVLGDPQLRALFGHSLVLVVFYSLIPIGLGLLITALLTRRPVRGMTAYRALLFVPQSVSLVVVAVAWQLMYAPDGIVNRALGIVGLDRHIAWLGEFGWALPAIGIIGSWLLTGLCMVLFIAGVQKIDPDLYAAAQMDGASPIDEFRFITLPGLRAEISVAVTLTVVAALRSFDLVYVLTKGGPGTSTSVPGLEIFERAFSRGQVGSASSLAVILTILICAVTVLIGRLSKEPE